MIVGPSSKNCFLSLNRNEEQSLLLWHMLVHIASLSASNAFPARFGTSHPKCSMSWNPNELVTIERIKRYFFRVMSINGWFSYSNQFCVQIFIKSSYWLDDKVKVPWVYGPFYNYSRLFRILFAIYYMRTGLQGFYRYCTIFGKSISKHNIPKYSETSIKPLL